MRIPLVAKTLPFAVILAAVLVACDDSLAPEPLPLDTTEPAYALAWLGTPVIDQHQKIADPSRPLAIQPPGVGQNLAQTFTAGRRGELAYVRLPVACDAGSLVRIQILKNGLLGGILSDYTYDPAHTVQDGTFLNFQIYSYVPMVPGRIHAIVLSSLARSGSSSPPSCSISSGPAGDSYPGGGAYYEDIPTNGPGWLPLPNRRNHGDLPFGTLLR